MKWPDAHLRRRRAIYNTMRRPNARQPASGALRWLPLLVVFGLILMVVMRWP